MPAFYPLVLASCPFCVYFTMLIFSVKSITSFIYPEQSRFNCSDCWIYSQCDQYSHMKLNFCKMAKIPRMFDAHICIFYCWRWKVGKKHTTNHTQTHYGAWLVKDSITANVDYHIHWIVHSMESIQKPIKLDWSAKLHAAHHKVMMHITRQHTDRPSKTITVKK